MKCTSGESKMSKKSYKKIISTIEDMLNSGRWHISDYLGNSSLDDMAVLDEFMEELKEELEIDDSE